MSSILSTPIVRTLNYFVILFVHVQYLGILFVFLILSHQGDFIAKSIEFKVLVGYLAMQRAPPSNGSLLFPCVL